jgi:hypothetical protein
MNQHKQLWLLTLLLLAMLGGGALATGFSTARLAQAQQSEASRKEKWEYCAITDIEDTGDQVFGRTGAAAVITYHELNGRRQERVEFRPTQVSQGRHYREDARAKATAKLGEEGWEMVGIQVTGENGLTVTYVFKRPKQ